MDVADHHVEHQQADDQALHEGVGDHTQYRCELLPQVDTQHIQLDKQRLPVRLLNTHTHTQRGTDKDHNVIQTGYSVR